MCALPWYTYGGQRTTVRVGFLLPPCGFGGSNSGCQPLPQALLPVEPSSQPFPTFLQPCLGRPLHSRTHYEDRSPESGWVEIPALLLTRYSFILGKTATPSAPPFVCLFFKAVKYNYHCTRLSWEFW